VGGSTFWLASGRDEYGPYPGSLTHRKIMTSTLKHLRLANLATFWLMGYHPLDGPDDRDNEARQCQRAYSKERRSSKKA